MAFGLVLLGWLAVFLLVTSMTIAAADVPAQGGGKAAGLLRPLTWLGSLAGNYLLFLVLHAVTRGGWDFLRTLRRMAEGRLSYQQLNFIYVILLLWVPLAGIMGVYLRSLLCSVLRVEKGYMSAPSRRRRKVLLLLSGSTLGMLLLGAIWFSSNGIRHLHINEICDRSISNVSDGAYVEFYNDGSLPCTLREMYLSDNQNNLKKYEIPVCTVPAGQWLAVPMGEVGFTFSKSGGATLYLSDRYGSVIDSVVTGSRRKGNYTYGLGADGVTWAFMLPTPGAANREGTLVEKPLFSHAAGYYNSEFTLTLTPNESNPDVEIHYTTDGSTPNADSPLYTEPIRVVDRSDQPNRWRAVKNIVYDWENWNLSDENVRKAFVVRAVAIDGDGTLGEEACATYLVGEKLRPDRAVISLVTDEKGLFGPDGMYVTGTKYEAWYHGDQKGDRPTANFDIHGWEQPVNIEYFADGGALTFAQTGGLRVQGGSTRWLPLKRFSVFARKEYAGRKVFDKPVFPGKATHSVGLRDGFCNAFSMALLPDRDFAVQLSVPVTVYLNGEFWYDTYMQERYNNTYFQQTFGVKETEFLKTGITDEILTYINHHDLSDQASYEGFDKIIDIQSYIDYICANVYLGNTDYSDWANVAIWRTTTKENDGFGDGRWRWCLYDMDLQTAGCRQNYGLTDITDAQLDTFNIVCDWDPPVNKREIYSALKANAGWRRQFVLTFMDLVNTDFAVENVTPLLEAWGEDISYDEYFFRDRPDNMIGFLAKEFDLRGSVQTLTLTVNDESAGTVQVNTAVPKLTDGTWTGRYFTDYPVTLTARPSPGYRFVSWEGANGGSEPTTEINMNGGVRIHAVFAKE